MPQGFSISAEAARASMIQGQLLPVGVTAPALLKAMGGLPRELFVPAHVGHLAYSDAVLDLDDVRCAIPPMVMARMAQAIQGLSADSILVVGCGMGYETALFSMIAARAIGIDSRPLLIEKAAAICADMSMTSAHFAVAPLIAGWPTMAPYDGIMILGAVPFLPDFVGDQLAVGGRAVMIEQRADDHRWGTAVLYHQTADGLVRRPLFDTAAPRLHDFYQNQGYDLL